MHAASLGLIIGCTPSILGWYQRTGSLERLILTLTLTLIGTDGLVLLEHLILTLTLIGTDSLVLLEHFIRGAFLVG